SFRMSNPRNRYAFETDGEKLYLSKYQTGERTVLAEQAFPLIRDTKYRIQIEARGSNIKVLVDGVEYFNVTDSQFKNGYFGPFSDREFVSFSAITTRQVAPPTEHWETSYAIWEDGEAQAEVKYSDIKFEDPEKDPMAGSYE